MKMYVETHDSRNIQYLVNVLCKNATDVCDNCK